MHRSPAPRRALGLASLTIAALVVGQGAPAHAADSVRFQFHYQLGQHYAELQVSTGTEQFSMTAQGVAQPITQHQTTIDKFVVRLQIIKVYPDGLFSQFLDKELAVGDSLELSGPFGVFTLRDAPDRDLVFVGGGAGLAPILCLLRTMAERGIDRKATFYYGARGERDLCFTGELRALEDALPGFRYIPALSHEEWSGEAGLITDVVRRLSGDLSRSHAYICGPPPMVEAAVPLMAQLGVPEKHVYFDKFTFTGETHS